MLARCKRWYKRRWLHSVYPGWHLFRSKERAIAEAAFDEVWFSNWYPWYVVGVLSALCLVGMWFVGITLVALLEPTPLVLLTLILSLPVTGAVFVSCDLLLMFAIRPFLQRSVWRGLRRKAIDVCPSCGYFLAGTPATTRHCPECGADRSSVKQPDTATFDVDRDVKPR
jgi:hypothetical protein